MGDAHLALRMRQFAARLVGDPIPEVADELALLAGKSLRALVQILADSNAALTAQAQWESAITFSLDLNNQKHDKRIWQNQTIAL